MIPFRRGQWRSLIRDSSSFVSLQGERWCSNLDTCSTNNSHRLRSKMTVFLGILDFSNGEGGSSVGEGGSNSSSSMGESSSSIDGGWEYGKNNAKCAPGWASLSELTFPTPMTSHSHPVSGSPPLTLQSLFLLFRLSIIPRLPSL